MPRPRPRRCGIAGTALALIAVMGTTGSAEATGREQAIGIPAYWPAGTEAGRAMFKELSYATPTVDIVIVNGPDSSAPRPFHPDTARAMRALRREGATILGYVDTGYLGRTGMTTTRVSPGSSGIADWREQIRADAAAWYELYGEFGLAGIFLDQTLSDCGTDDEYVDTYGRLGWEIQRRQRGSIIAINPGTTVDECYTDVADIIMIFENTYEEYVAWEPPAWVYEHPETTFWHLVHGARDQSQMRTAIDLSRRRHAGFVYVTSHEITGELSPWHALPDQAYWTAQLRAVARPWPADP